MNEQHQQSSKKNYKKKMKKLKLFSIRPSHCQRILLFAESPSGSRRMTASKSFDDGLDDNNLDDSKIVSALK